MIKFLPLIFILGLNGCADLLTHRSFIDEMDRETDPLFIPGEDFHVLSGDSGEAGALRLEEVQVPVLWGVV